jgi:hypothetical protein
MSSLEEENKNLKKIIEGVELYREQKLKRTLSDIGNQDLILDIRNIILENEYYRNLIINSIGNNFFLDDNQTAILLTGSIIQNYRFTTAKLSLDEIEQLNKNQEFKNSIATQSLMQIITMSDNYEEITYNKFSYTPIVSASYSIAKLLIDRIDRKLDYDNMFKLHESKLFELIPIYLKEAMYSLISTLVLLSRNAYSQGFITLRTLIEQVIIISTLAKHPEALEAFELHNRLKINEELKTNLKDVDRYLESKGINPTNMTLRSKYIDYGWLDSIKEFESDQSKKMYRVKTMAKIVGLDEYYEWYASWSNYVHSNFLLLTIDWNKLVNIAISQISSLLVGMIDMYKWLTNYDFNYKGIDLNKYLKDLIEALKLVEGEDFNYDLIKK